jgi:TusA-related sulfurtransferase
MLLQENTRIGAVLKHNSEALEAIISLSPKFEKLRNPLLRKLIAGRTTIAEASKIGGCVPEDFFKKLQPLGFEIKRSIINNMETTSLSQQPLPEQINTENIVDFDVRPILAGGKDPLKQILAEVKALKSGEVLKIISDFEPTPLVSLLKKQGFESYTRAIEKDLIHTYFFKNGVEPVVAEETEPLNDDNWDQLLEAYKDNIVRLDVREMEMPKPMHTILENLEKINNDGAILVNHRRVPVFLIPELKERGFDIRVLERGENDVLLLIFKNI